MKVRVYFKTGSAFDFTTDDVQAKNAVGHLAKYAQDPKPINRGLKFTHLLPHGAGTTHADITIDYDAVAAVMVIE